MNSVIAGIDLGGTNVRTAIVARNGAVISKDARHTEADDGPEGVIGTMVASVESALAQAEIDATDLLAVGSFGKRSLNFSAHLPHRSAAGSVRAIVH